MDMYYWKCPVCSSPIDLEYPVNWLPRGYGVARYNSLLPVYVEPVYGEGETPLVSREYNGLKVFFKLEYLNPSGSFKDRGTVVALTYAKRLGYTCVVEDTSGNTGISIALYAKALGLHPIIVVPEYIPVGKKKLLELYGAEIVYASDRSKAALKALEVLSQNPKRFYAAHTWSPFYIEGYKTIAYELYEQGFRRGMVVAPIGSGGLYLGLYRGFRDLYNLGLIEEIPFLLGVQGASVQPVYKMIYNRVVKGESYLADGLMVENPPRLEEIASIVKEYGDVVVVDNDEIVDSLKWLVRNGFIVEPTSAAILAGLKKYVSMKKIRISGEVCVLLTGSGLKMLEDIYVLVKTRH